MKTIEDVIEYLDELQEARRNRSRNYKEGCRLEGIHIINTMYPRNRKISLNGVKMELGEIYVVRGRLFHICRLIQTTPLGYNLLDLKTHRCILKQHLYVPVKQREQYNGDVKYVYTPDFITIFKNPIKDKVEL